MPDTDKTSALEVAERVRANVEKLGIEHNGSPEHKVVTVSVGLATDEPKSNDITYDGLLEPADKHLYSAKESGRNKISHG